MGMQGSLLKSTGADGEHCSSRKLRQTARICGICLGIVVFDLVFGTAWHEFMGHGLCAIAFGAKITYLEVMGFQLYPDFCWVGPTPYFGRCLDSGVNSEIQRAWVLLCGSLSTWIAGVVGVILLYTFRWRGWSRILMIALGTWWLDLLLYTLPSLGIPRYFFWGHYHSEPYKAAVALGVPGPVFQGLVVLTSFILAAALAGRIWTRERGEFVRRKDL